MRLDCFLLADAATVHAGKLYIHGGGITKLTPASVPFILPQLAVVIRWVARPQDLKEDHLATFTLTDPDGDSVIAPTALPIMVKDAALERTADGEESVVQLALTFAGVPIFKIGSYQIVVSLNGELARAMTLPVVLADQRD